MRRTNVVNKGWSQTRNTLLRRRASLNKKIDACNSIIAKAVGRRSIAEKELDFVIRCLDVDPKHPILDMEITERGK